MGNPGRYAGEFILDEYHKENRFRMNILIPMAGAGKRFSEAGYKKSKPAIPTYDRRSGKKVPMVVCATMDLPYVELGGGSKSYICRQRLSQE